jgi:hypothetical protein
MSMQTQALPRIVDALAFAADAHRHQRRKDADATPYINHPLALVRILAVEAGIDDVDVLCAAALHDYLEDCCGGEGQPTVQAGRALLGERFGPQVLADVAAVSDDKSLPKAERKRLHVARHPSRHASPHAAPAPTGAKPCAIPTSAETTRYAQSDAGKAARVSIGLCLNPPIAWSMTSRQHQVFVTLCRLQREQAGEHSLLPNVMEALLWLARRPGWDAGTAGIPVETEDSADPCAR